MVVFFCVVFLSVLFPVFLFSGEPPQDVLPEVVVTATRLRDVEEPASAVPGKVIVISSEEIQKLGAKTVQEALQHQAGIIFYDSIGNEFQQSIDLRGFNAQPVPATTVFVDGVRVNEPDFNTINFDLIPIEDIERIEIMPGTATVFGRNALGGVINIITRRGRTDRPHFEVAAGGGSFGRHKYSFNTDGPLPLGGLDYYLGVTRELTAGFREGTAGRISRLFGKLGYTSGADTDVTLSYTHVHNKLRQAGALPLDVLRVDRRADLTPGDYSAADLHMLAFNARQRLSGGLSMAVNAFVRDNDLEGFVRGLASESLLETQILSTGGTVQLSHLGALLGRRNLTTVGAEYTRNRFDITNRGIFLPAFSFLSQQRTYEDVGGFYFTNTFTIHESLSVNGGLRYDWDRFNFTDRLNPALSGRKNFQRVSPKAGLVYTPVPQLSFTFSYSEGIRVPTVTEMFAQGPFGSNPDLVPMKSRNFELGAKARWSEWLEASVSLFHMPVRDEILFVVTDPVLFLGRNENIRRTLRQGAEFSVRTRYQGAADAFVNYTVTKSTFETDVLLFSGQVRRGDELPLVPRHRVTTGVNVYPVEGATLSFTGTYVGSQFLVGDEPNEARRLAAYWVLNSRIAYRWRNWTAFVNLNNLTDRKYSTAGILVTEPFLVPAPGFNVFGGLSFSY